MQQIWNNRESIPRKALLDNPQEYSGGELRAEDCVLELDRP